MQKYSFSTEKQSMYESLPQPLAIYQYVNKRVVPIVLSDGFCELFGYDDRDKAYLDMSTEMFKFDHPDDVGRLSNAAVKFATEGGDFNVVYRSKTRDGSGLRIIHATGKFVEVEAGVKLAFIWFIDEGPYTNEASDGKGAFRHLLNNALHEESLVRASLYDHLTGLPSMTYFFQLAEEGKNAILEEGGQPVLLYFDVNGMKYFNTKHSFAEGNRLLQSIASLLRSTFGIQNCCHVGADHFAAYTKEEGLKDTLNRFFVECSKLNGGDSRPIRVGIYPNHLEDVHVSIACDRAKFACDALKNTFESCYNYYDKKLRDEAVRRQYILTNIDKAIKERWIQVYYQPIVRAVNGRVCDDEALARWIDPVEGFLSPGEFIPFLEDAKVIYKLDLYVLEQVLEKLKRQKEAGLFLVPQSINLSRSDFDACDIVEEIRKRVDAAGIDRSNITIEITESTIGKNFSFMKTQVERFQKLGFPVWMDDFGSGYSSLDVLQSIKFDLLKFDMSFMQRLYEGNSAKIILTELMRMATALGIETVCEGVETEDQAHFLREIGCSKLQGYYFAKPTPLDKLIERYEKGIQIGYENPEESAYYETIGRVNLYDLAVIANGEDYTFQNYFNTLPMAIMELDRGKVRFVRSNHSYREFMMRVFKYDLAERDAAFTDMPIGIGSSFMNLVKQCCVTGSRAFFDEQLPDGSIVHSFARKIGANPVNGRMAVAVAVLSITAPNEGTTYASIARALAADYYNLYYVDLETELFIEYSSPVGGEELAMERHGDHFFESVKNEVRARVYKDDQELFLNGFTKDKIIHELDEHGAFTATYRLIDTGKPVYVNMKIMRMQNDGRYIIIGISVIDSQMKQQETFDRFQREEAAYARVMALSGDYMSLYTVDPETGSYIEYIVSPEYESLGFEKSGEDFFRQGIIDGKKCVFAEDLPTYIEKFNKDNVLGMIRKERQFQLHYRLVINGVPRPVVLKIVSVRDKDGEKLVAGVRAWKERR